MKDVIAELIKGLLGSKKFVGLVAGLVGLLLLKLKFSVDPDTINKYVLMVMTWLGAQGIADFNKEAAKVNGGQ